MASISGHSARPFALPTQKPQYVTVTNWPVAQGVMERDAVGFAALRNHPNSAATATSRPIAPPARRAYPRRGVFPFPVPKPPIRHCDVLACAAGGGRKPECAIATETQLPTGPVGSIRTAEPVATPSLLW